LVVRPPDVAVWVHVARRIIVLPKSSRLAARVLKRIANVPVPGPRIDGFRPQRAALLVHFDVVIETGSERAGCTDTCRDLAHMTKAPAVSGSETFPCATRHNT
jgi:hypothetical protein